MVTCGTGITSISIAYAYLPVWWTGGNVPMGGGRSIHVCDEPTTASDAILFSGMAEAEVDVGVGQTTPTAR